MIAFTDGSNYVTGDVLNFDPDPAMPNNEGIIYISGPNTLVVFENDLLSGPGAVLRIEEGADVDIIARHSFVTAGELMYELNATNSSRISTAGDVGIAGKLSVTLSGFATDSLSIGDSFEIISAGGQIGGVDLGDPLRPRPDLTMPALFTNVMVDDPAMALPSGAIMRPVYGTNSVSLTVIGAAVVTLPGDYNNNGIVDAADYVVWRNNFGTTNPLPNDPYGGVIDGVQYNTWRIHFGAVPGAGAGLGSAALSVLVPEPASLSLVFCIGLIAMVWHRSRC
jgi:hypothetical protein